MLFRSRARTHFLNWAPADYLSSRVRGRSLATNDPMLRLVYFELLNNLHAAGGALPNDSGFLADAVGTSKEEIELTLPILLELGSFGRGGIFNDANGELQNRRISEELEEKETFRREQAEHGKRGALSRSRGQSGDPDSPEGQPEAGLGSRPEAIGQPKATLGLAKDGLRQPRATPPKPSLVVANEKRAK